MNKKILFIFLGFIFLLILFFILEKNDTSKYDLININYNKLIDFTKEKKDFVLVVSRSTCSHCEEYKPKVKEIAQKNKINIYYIDYDLEKEKNQTKFLSEFKLNGATPMTLFFKNGKEISILNRIEGNVDSNLVFDALIKMKYIEK